jgi:hypothetical protein
MTPLSILPISILSPEDLAASLGLLFIWIYTRAWPNIISCEEWFHSGYRPKISRLHIETLEEKKLEISLQTYRHSLRQKPQPSSFQEIETHVRIANKLHWWSEGRWRETLTPSLGIIRMTHAYLILLPGAYIAHTKVRCSMSYYPCANFAKSFGSWEH